MANDYFDTESGLDTDEYVRAEYAPHPILAGLISKSGLARSMIISVLILLALTLYFTIVVDPLVLVIGLLGIAVSIFYVAPPIRLKSRGLGELSVFIVWGPLMIGVTYLVTTGTLPPEIIILSLPYAITVMTVLIGKHVDKIEADKKKGIHTLPVIIGENTAKWLNIFLMFSFYVLVVGSVLLGLIGIGVLISLIGIYRFIIVTRIYRQPKPITPPPNYPVWPLWYVSQAFWHNKLAGGLFVLGLLINVVLLGLAPDLAFINIISR